MHVATKSNSTTKLPISDHNFNTLSHVFFFLFSASLSHSLPSSLHPSHSCSNPDSTTHLQTQWGEVSEPTLGERGVRSLNLSAHLSRGDNNRRASAGRRRRHGHARTRSSGCAPMTWSVKIGLGRSAFRRKCASSSTPHHSLRPLRPLQVAPTNQEDNSSHRPPMRECECAMLVTVQTCACLCMPLRVCLCECVCVHTRDSVCVYRGWWWEVDLGSLEEASSGLSFEG